MAPEQSALPPGFLESLDEKTRSIVAIAVLSERQANHEKFHAERFVSLQDDITDVKTDLQRDISTVKSGLDDNSRAQKSYFIWIVGLMLAATGAFAFLYLTGAHHAV
jgi:hypothetical protein